jgi:adenylate cyclase
MSGDQDQEYFSDGLTENIIAGLSVDGRLLVIARNSTFSYKGKPVKVQEVARELGAQYVVEGSVQKTEDRVRITVQLIDANTGHHVWADTYDRDLKDIFALQDEIAINIMAAVGMKLLDGKQFGQEIIPPSGSLQVFMKQSRAFEYMYRMNKEDNILARQELEEAIALDPEHAVLYSMLAVSHFMDLLYQTSKSPLISFAEASKNTKKALALNDEDWTAHFALSHLYLARKEYDKAIAAVERAIAINPNGAVAYTQLGYLLTCSGRAEEAIIILEKAMRLNPIPPPQYLHLLGFAYQVLGRYEDAIEFYKKVLKRSPNHVFAQVNLTGAYSALGREEEARRQAEEALRLDPAFSVDRFAETIYMKDEAVLEKHISDLRKAGLK